MEFWVCADVCVLFSFNGGVCYYGFGILLQVVQCFSSGSEFGYCLVGWLLGLVLILIRCFGVLLAWVVCSVLDWFVLLCWLCLI